MTQIHKIRPTNDRLVEWSAEEMQQMYAVMRSCIGFVESRWPGEQPRYCEETDTQADAPRQHRLVLRQHHKLTITSQNNHLKFNQQ